MRGAGELTVRAPNGRHHGGRGGGQRRQGRGPRGRGEAALGSAVGEVHGVVGPRELAVGEVQLLQFLWRASAVRSPGDFFVCNEVDTRLLIVWMSTWLQLGLVLVRFMHQLKTK